MGPEHAGRSRGGVILAGAVVAAFFVGLVAFQVQAGDLAVVTTFGRPRRAVLTPGLNFKLPWPIQAVHRFDGRLQTFVPPPRQALTSDRRWLAVEVYVAWRVEEPLAFLARGGSQAAAEGWLERELAGQMGPRVGAQAYATLLSAKGAGEFEAALLAAVRPPLQAAGVAVEQLGIRRLALPESVTAAVFERMTQERERAAQLLLAEGTTAAAKIRAEADRAYTVTVAEAEAEAMRIQAAAERQATASFRALNQSPDLAAFLQEVETLDAIVDDQTTLVLPADGPAVGLLKGPPVR